MLELFTEFDLSESLKATTVLFAVIDIVGSIPIIIKIKQSSGSIHELSTSLASMGIMFGFLIVGESILKLFGVEIEAFAVAGAIILFAMAFEMILGIRVFRDEVSGKTASIVPLAFPIFALHLRNDGLPLASSIVSGGNGCEAPDAGVGEFIIEWQFIYYCVQLMLLFC